MRNKHYRYIPWVRNLKTTTKILPFIYLLLTSYIVLGYTFGGYYDRADVFYMLSGIPWVIFFVVFFLGDYPEIKVDKNGLYVEFLWTYLPVPWKDIIEIKHFRLLFLEWWLVTVDNRLTFFHRIYSIYSLKSVLPSFLIHHNEMENYGELSKLMQEKGGIR